MSMIPYTWTNQTPLPQALVGTVLVTSGAHIFALGGQQADLSTMVPTSYSAPIASNGSIGSWTQLIDLPGTFQLGQSPKVFFYGNYLFALGGILTTPALTNTVWRAKILKGGLLDAWTPISLMPNNNLATVGGFIDNANLYLYGGYIAGPVQDPNIYVANIGSNFTLTPWKTIGTLTGTPTPSGGGLGDNQFSFFNNDTVKSVDTVTLSYGVFAGKIDKRTVPSGTPYSGPAVTYNNSIIFPGSGITYRTTPGKLNPLFQGTGINYTDTQTYIASSVWQNIIYVAGGSNSSPVALTNVVAKTLGPNGEL